MREGTGYVSGNSYYADLTGGFFDSYGDEGLVQEAIKNINPSTIGEYGQL